MKNVLKAYNRSSNMAGASVAVPKLSAEDAKREKIVQLQNKVALRASEKGAPLVRVHDIPRGLGRGKKLSVGQNQWLKSTTFDGKTGNPVIAKQLKQYSTESVNVIERREAVLEVEALSEQPLCQSGGSRQISDVMERVQKKRKIRHEQALGDLSQELAAIGEDQSYNLTKLSEQLKTTIAEKEHEIKELLRKHSLKETLKQCQIEDLGDLWTEIEQLFALKRQSVIEYEGACDELETQRVAMLLDIVKNYGVTLTSIGYLLPDEVERVMEEEAHTINMSVLCNRRTYTQLCQHLVTTDYMMEKNTRQHWEELVVDWQVLTCQLLEEKFREFMSSDEVISPEEMEKLRNEFVSKIGSINKERESLLNQLSVLRPSPTSTAVVYEWRDSYLQLQQQLEEAYGQFLLGWQKCIDKISSRCEEELNQCKEYLGASKAVESESKVFEILSSRFVPLLEQHQSRMADELKITERSIEVMLASQGAQFLSLFQHAQGAAHLWTGHLKALEQVKQAHKESLRSLRSQHDSKNQSKEAHLDLVLDRLRQSSCSEELSDYLKQSLEMLESIKEGYTEFRQLLVTEAQKYPCPVQEVLNTYDTSICKYFGVGRTPSKKRKKPKIFPAKSSESPRSMSRGGGRSTSSRAMSRTSSVSSVRSNMPPRSPLRSAIEEVISTSQGTSFYVLTHSNDGIESGPSIFLTQDEESEGVQVTFASEAIQLSEALFAESKKGLCASFLDHLESWKTGTAEQAVDDTAGKEEELRTELELRHHLHDPRPSRVEDIHNTRSVELITHQSRVGKHANAVTASLKELKALTEQLQTDLQEKVESFSGDISDLETRLPLVTSMKRLEKIHAQARAVFDKHKVSMESTMNHHTEVVKESLVELRRSNTAYQRSLRLFSQGGNYCPQEVDFISKKLEKLFSKMATTQKLITRDAESYSETSLERSVEIMTGRFDSSYRQNVNDVLFLEAVAKILTNCQLKIKTEVAYCDTQSQKLCESVQKLNPTANPTSASILDELSGVLAAFSAHTDYLYCWSSYHRGARVGVGDQGRSAKRASISVSAVNVTKSIMRYAGKTNSASPGVNERAVTRGGIGKGSMSMPESETKGYESMGKISGKASVVKRKQLLAERMNISFGLGGGDDGSNCFLPNIRAILASSYRELYTTSELYYKQKSSKTVTRPDQIQESFQACMDQLIVQCQNLREQAETYRNNCIDEFHHHLSLLSDTLVSVSDILLGGVDSRHGEAVQNKIATLEAAHHNVLTELARLKEEHVTQLRPGLGHPSRAAELAKLCTEEKTRHDRAMDCITQHTSTMKVALEEAARLFAVELVEVTQTLLTLYNDAVSPNDVLPPKKTVPTTQQLLRELVHPQNNEGHTKHTAVKPTWPAIGDHRLAFGDKLTIKKLESIPVSTKVTTGHSSVIEARDKIYEKYSTVCLKRLQSVTEEDQLQRKKEEKDSSVWITSVERVQQLYK